MNLTLRYVALALVTLLSLHYLASYTSTAYHNQVDTLRSSWSSSSSKAVDLIAYANTPKANATFVILCREGELNGILASLQLLESTFNDRPHHRYPYVFLNDQPFSEKFKLHVTRAVSSSVEFGQVPAEHWDIPSSIDLGKAQKSWDRAKKTGMPYGGSKSYRQMCRFQSGFFFRHPLLLRYKYYWRVEPDVKYFCDLTNYDPFRFMQQNKKKYGFVLAMHDIPGTVRTLWVHVRQWYEKNPGLLVPNNMFGFVTDNNGRGYNMVCGQSIRCLLCSARLGLRLILRLWPTPSLFCCTCLSSDHALGLWLRLISFRFVQCHYWSNLEIADMDFYRSEAYLSYFDHLDQAGGFFYERWGDAPVHSIAASLLLDKSEVHYFDNIGYLHHPIMHCPKVSKQNAISPHTGKSRCYCAHETSFAFDDGRHSCLYNFLEVNGRNSTAARDEFRKADD